MSSHADTIRAYIMNSAGHTLTIGADERHWHALAALDALLAENQRLRQGILRSSEKFAMDAADREHLRVHELEDALAEALAENQRLREALKQIKDMDVSRDVRWTAHVALAAAWRNEQPRGH